MDGLRSEWRSASAGQTEEHCSDCIILQMRQAPQDRQLCSLRHLFNEHLEHFYQKVRAQCLLPVYLPGGSSARGRSKAHKLRCGLWSEWRCLKVAWLFKRYSRLGAAWLHRLGYQPGLQSFSKTCAYYLAACPTQAERTQALRTPCHQKLL